MNECHCRNQILKSIKFYKQTVNHCLMELKLCSWYVTCTVYENTVLSCSERHLRMLTDMDKPKLLRGHQSIRSPQYIIYLIISLIPSYKLHIIICHPSSVIRHLSSVICHPSSVICHLSSVIRLTIYLFSAHLCSILSELDSEDLHLV